MNDSPKKLLIATGNRGKFFEIKALLQTLKIEAVSSSEFNLLETVYDLAAIRRYSTIPEDPHRRCIKTYMRSRSSRNCDRRPSKVEIVNGFLEPEETGSTFEENALIKAKFYGKKTGLPALADDSGLCVEAMNGRPGIHSARFALNEKGEKDFPAAFKKIAENIGNNQRAFFICSLAFFDPKTNFLISFEGRVDGNLIFPPRGNLGFGYDPIFIKDGMTKTFGEIPAAEKDKISHRAKAFKKFSDWLVKGS